MGDRALIQLKSADEGLSPCLYLHWSGRSVPALLDGAARQMASRGPDLSYWFARLVGRACNMNGGDNEALSVGVFPQKSALTAQDSHGDAGVFLVDLPTMTVYYGGGYTPYVDADSPLKWEKMAKAERGAA